ncbi:8-oxoguanine DNA glycosylase OGG fold protein [Streptomyces zhihengii]
MRFDQSRADKLDEALLELLLPEGAARSLGQWLADPERGRQYAQGSGSHSVACTPSQWMAVAPWPRTFADRAAIASASVSRAQVVAAVRCAARSESWAEAFVATQVWGYGRAGYGPCRTSQVLAQPKAEVVFAEAVRLLVDEGAVAAYDMLNTLDGLGPAFLTKFLYFAGQALPEVRGPLPLILDRVVAGVLRRHATAVGRVAGYEWSDAIAARVWRDGGWTSHRYGVYLKWMYAANDQLAAASISWPAGPDVLELALFSAAWDPE